ncbi:MAG: ubiquinone biosynthesis regulatory protein kinase UbiB, partial [Gammaproteobacteria bacterium]
MQPWLWRRPPGDYGERLRDALVHLGPVFVKFGQLISTRKDLFPDEITNPLQALQDRVPPVDGVDAKSALAEIFGQPVEALFAEFDTTPLASASVAQVHAAKLPNGEAVVIKWLRPGIERIVALDVALMKSVSQFLHRRLPKIRRFRLPEVVADYRRTILDELDLRREAANQAQLHRNFADSEDLYIPKVYWDYCHRRAMVSERIYGLGVGDIEKLRAAGVNMQRLAEKGVSVFFTQVFRDNFFHADMHPGNIFVDATHPDNPKYIG